MEGWICPRCGRVLAPFMIECGCEKKSDISYSDRTTTTAIPAEIDPGFYTGTIGGWCIDKCVEEIKRTPITIMPKEEPKIVIEAKPQLPYNEVIAPLVAKITTLKRSDEVVSDEKMLARREAYNLAIDDVLDLLYREMEKTVVIEITAPCNHRCEVCEKKCKEKDNGC